MGKAFIDLSELKQKGCYRIPLGVHEITGSTPMRNVVAKASALADLEANTRSPSAKLQ